MPPYVPRNKWEPFWIFLGVALIAWFVAQIIKYGVFGWFL